MSKTKNNTKKRTKIKKTKKILNEKKPKLTYENEKNEIKQKKRLKNIKRPIFYRLETSADVKKQQKMSAGENLTN
jgi:hypothetical protein